MLGEVDRQPSQVAGFQPVAHMEQCAREGAAPSARRLDGRPLEPRSPTAIERGRDRSYLERSAVPSADECAERRVGGTPASRRSVWLAVLALKALASQHHVPLDAGAIGGATTSHCPG